MNVATMAPDGASRAQQAAKAALALLLTGLGLWTLHRYLPALIWAAILAIAVWPLYQRAVRRWPPGKHNILLPSVFTVALGLMFIVPLVLVAVQAGKEMHGVFEAIDTGPHRRHPAAANGWAICRWAASRRRTGGRTTCRPRIPPMRCCKRARQSRVRGERPRTRRRARAPGGAVRLHAC